MALYGLSSERIFLKPAQMCPLQHLMLILTNLRAKIIPEMDLQRNLFALVIRVLCACVRLLYGQKRKSNHSSSEAYLQNL